MKKRHFEKSIIMKNGIDEIQTIRDRLLTRSLSAIVVIGFPALVASLSRAIYTGWQDVMSFHIIVYSLSIGIYLLRERLSYNLKAWIVTGGTFALGIAGLLTWGLVSFGVPALFSACMLSTIYFGTPKGIFFALLSILSIGMIGGGIQSGLITFQFDPKTYMSFFSSWLAAMVAMTLSAGIIVVVMGSIDKNLVALVRALDKRNGQLVKANKCLETEIREHTRTEKERLELEMRLMRAKKMEALGTLAGGVAHDLNNILAGSVSYPDLLLMQLPQDSPLRKPIETIKKSGIKAATIVQDLLAYARRGVFTMEVVNLNDVVEDYLKSPEFERLKSYHPGVEIETLYTQDLSYTLGSPVHLTKLVMNLVSNGAEAMPEGGKLTLSTENCHVSQPIKGYDLIKEGDYVVLRIADTGCGISPEDKERIFEPFYTKKVMGRSGTGLGMAVVWGTVKDHQGHINVDSREEEGTIFTVYFPVTKQELPKAKPAIPMVEYRGHGESILVVDDVKEQREIATSMFQELGYSAMSVSCGAEAIEYAKKNAVHLLILDMIMEPGIDGLDTYKKILEMHPKQKAIITSGFPETDRVKEAQLMGAGQYIKKPYTLETIGMAAREELNK